jgi:galacturan 1,4-alpha-galacturonidase
MGFTRLLLLQLFASALIARAAPSETLFERTPVQFGKRATCTPASAGDASVDDVPAIAAAIKSCGNGGVILIPAGKTYMIRSTLSFSGCSNCDFQLEGTLKASDDTSYWNGKQAIISVSGITGLKFHSVTGSGLLDGNGQAAWDLFAKDTSFKRPTLHYITGSKNVAVSNLRVKNPQKYFLFPGKLAWLITGQCLL